MADDESHDCIECLRADVEMLFAKMENMARWMAVQSEILRRVAKAAGMELPDDATQFH